jgi:hypothetical protein
MREKERAEAYRELNEVFGLHLYINMYYNSLYLQLGGYEYSKK